LDTFLDYPNCILGWILAWPDPGWAKTIRVKVEQSRPKSTSSRVVRAQFESSRYGLKSTKSFWTKVEPSQPWAKLSWVADIESTWVEVGPGQCLLELVHAHVELSLSGSIWSRAGPGRYPDNQAKADVEPSGPKLLSSRPGSGQCWVEQAKADIEPSKPGPMLNREGPTDVEQSRPEPMSSRPGRGRFRAEQANADRAERAQADIESIGPWSKSSRMGPSRCRVERAWADIESIGPGSKSSPTGLGRSQVLRAWADVES